jgi:hypothetical protein
MIVAFNDFDVLVESEDGASQEERLRHVIEQSGSYVLDADHLIGYERDAAHDEQHRTSVLRDFESRVFHSRFLSTFFTISYPFSVLCPLPAGS